MKNTLVLCLTVSVGVTPLFAAPVSIDVVDEAGAPVAKATVQFESFAKSPPGLVVAETSADGKVSLDIEPGKQSSDFLGRIVVWKQEFALGGGNLSLKKPLKVVLKKGDVLRGVVLDNTKKPVKGARIVFSNMKNDDGTSTFMYRGPLMEKMTTSSDENGTWQLACIPTNAQVYIAVIAPGFAADRPSGTTKEPIQTQLRIGSALRGKLLGLDGKPLPDIRVYAQPSRHVTGVNGYADAKTRADGSFNLEGLEAGAYNVMFEREEDADYVIAAFESINVAAGETKDLTEARALEGVLIGGKVTEKGTGKPVEGASVGVYGALNPASSAAVSSATTGEDGGWKLRTLPGQSKVYIMGTPTGYLREPNLNTKTLDISAQGKSELNFELERAPKITGRVVDAAGNGVAASLMVIQKYEQWALNSDENGDFEVYGPKNGEIEFGLPRYGSDPGFNWDVVGDPKRTIPVDQPIEVQVTKAKLLSFEAHVYDETGTPVQGAKVSVYVATGKGDGMTSQVRELVSDKDGVVKIEDLRTSQSVNLKGIQKASYDLISEFKVEQKDNVFQASDIILSKRNGKIAGQVLSANGEAIAGVTVSALGIESTSDASGKFVLEPLPKGKVEVLAYKDDLLALVADDKAVHIELKPQTLQGVDKVRAAQILSDLREQTKDTSYWRKDSLGAEGTADFDAMAAKIGTTQVLDSFARLVERYGSDQSIPLTRWTSLIFTVPSATNRLLISTMLAHKRGKLEDDTATRAWLDGLQYDQAQLLKQNFPQEAWMIAGALFAVVSVADKIGNTEATDQALAEATAYITKHVPEKAESGKPSLHQMFGGLGELIGSSPRILDKLLPLVPVDSGAYSQLLRDSIPQIVRNSGLENARPYLEKLKNAPAPKPDANGNQISVEWAYWDSVVKAIEIGAKGNPQLALELANSLPRSASVGNYDARPKALVAAAFSQDKAVAESLWRESLPLLETSLAMRNIVKIARTDEKLGHELYEITRKNLDAQPENDPNAMISGRQRDIPAFAFYESKFNPARARYRLEKAFQKVKSEEYARYYLGSYARAMVVFDADRALEMANALSASQNDNFSQFEAKRGIAEWLSSDENKRENANFAARYGQDWEF